MRKLKISEANKLVNSKRLAQLMSIGVESQPRVLILKYGLFPFHSLETRRQGKDMSTKVWVPVAPAQTSSDTINHSPHPPPSWPPGSPSLWIWKRSCYHVMGPGDNNKESAELSDTRWPDWSSLNAPTSCHPSGLSWDWGQGKAELWTSFIDI